MRPAVLIDLDDTLMPDEAAAVAAFLATAQVAAGRRPLDADALARTVRVRARELWHAAPTYPYCVRIGISSWEGLWCRYEGELGEMPALRAWAPTYRREAWRAALADQDVDDDALADELGERFAIERRTQLRVYTDAGRALRDLRRRGHRLALVSNGAPCLQREKLDASGLAGFFDAVVVSGDAGVGAAKPGPAPFRRALALLGTPGPAVMVGDSYVKDVKGALNAGIGAIWLNRAGAERPEGATAAEELSTLGELAEQLRRIE